MTRIITLPKPKGSTLTYKETKLVNSTYANLVITIASDLEEDLKKASNQQDILITEGLSLCEQVLSKAKAHPMAIDKETVLRIVSYAKQTHYFLGAMQAFEDMEKGH